ncbi:hypothetical protein OEA41_000410 [Lepraria neglecta]|uniref:Arrestin-like N-terminal domain-containing protein n=1 Tax=Lepraria neglecta TaxID=209136 RepID=A0AAD9ZII3_9LECA|nr:hypothetical protein OEA41_000410 [Lepraria neglecta]
MSIRINVPDTRCRPGSTISGTVSLHGNEDIDVQFIAISLVARSKTKIRKSQANNSSTTYRGRAPLIQSKRGLFTGPHTLHPGHSWPFSFALPECCAAVGADPFKEERGPFNLDRQQSLPPAFNSSNFSYGYSAECFITYELEASLVGSRAKLFSSGDLESTRTLQFMTTRDVEIPEPQLTTKTWPISCASLRLEPGRENDSLTFKEKLKSMRTSKLPMARFTIRMQLPTVGVPNMNLPIILSVEHNIEDSSAPSPPLVILKKCSIFLRAYTHIQAIRNEIFNSHDIERNWDETHEIAHCDFSGQMDKAPPITEHSDLQYLMKIVIPRHHKPSFSTFNIRRYYNLGIRLSVECAQKTFKSELETYHFDLLAPEYARNVVEPATASGSNTVEYEAAPVYEANAGMPLPRYEEPPKELP